mmetsp:Transcript_26139/g.72020  ORF Transcript_26139/g.72020 Transcript_26139/m.72020 type:complete len:205 (-) Transcript_26139:81-695(-)
MCTVDHAVGRVHASSAAIHPSITATSRASVRACDASAASAWPTTGAPARMSVVRLPQWATSAAQSLPGIPGSPGYRPSTLSTSRKLSPTARTRKSTAPSTDANASSSCGTTLKFEMAPRASKCSCTGPQSDFDASKRRGTRTSSPSIATSGSRRSKYRPPSKVIAVHIASSGVRGRRISSRVSRTVGVSDRACRPSPSSPACAG